MSTVPLPSQPHLGQLRQQARELQRAVRAGDAEALALVAGHRPAGSPASAYPLSAAQTVLARRYGFPSWARLRRHVEVIAERTWVLPAPDPAESPGERFLRLACLTYTDDHPDRWTEAARSRPARGGTNLAVAAADADVERVEQLLAEDPDAARATYPPFGWSPLMYQAYARHDPDIGRRRTLDTAARLLAAGADPDDGRFFLGLPTPFTVLTGVFASGQPGQPAHPHASDLARLLLRAGADPNDGQTLYNRMFGLDDDHLRVLFEFGLGTGEGGPWHRRLPDQLETPAQMMAALSGWAIGHDQRDRVALLVEHGLDINRPLPARRWSSAPAMTPLEFALLSGHPELADQLRGYGAAEPRLSTVDAFVAAALCADAATVAATPAGVVDQARRARPGLPVWAAGRGKAAAVELLVSAGFDINALGRGDTPIEQPWSTALHAAVESDHLALARRLLALGADPDRRDRRFDATPLDWARHLGRPALVALLAPVTDQGATGDVPDVARGSTGLPSDS